MKIYIKFDTYRTGLLCVQSGKCFFPFDDWNDLYLDILNMWMYSLNQFQDTPKATFDMPFMDGPYNLLCKKSGDVLTVKGIDEHIDEGVVKFEETMSYERMKNMVCECAKNLLDAFPEHKETDDDMVELYQELRKVKVGTGDGSLFQKSDN